MISSERLCLHAGRAPRYTNVDVGNKKGYVGKKSQNVGKCSKLLGNKKLMVGAPRTAGDPDGGAVRHGEWGGGEGGAECITGRRLC